MILADFEGTSLPGNLWVAVLSITLAIVLVFGVLLWCKPRQK
jgi:hypothetical protein